MNLDCQSRDKFINIDCKLHFTVRDHQRVHKGIMMKYEERLDLFCKVLLPSSGGRGSNIFL